LNKASSPIRGYYNAVGNDGLSHYQGQFVNSGFSTASWDFHRYQANILTTDAGVGLPCDTGSPAFCGDTLLLAPGGSLIVLMQWNDPYGASSNDYDLFLVNETAGTFNLASGGEQNGNDDPVEAFGWVNNTANPQLLDVVIGRYSGAARTLDVFQLCDGCYPVPDGIFGQPLHNFNTKCTAISNNSDAGGGVVAIAAIDVDDPGTNTIEPYSSCGPTEDGRVKPDGTTVDGVSVTGNAGFGSPFFGTSAAAPHAGGIAALLLDCNPGLSRDALRSALLDTAVDLGAAGVDNLFGSGRISSLNAANSISCGPTPTPTVTPTITPTPTVTPTPTPKDPDGDTDGDTVVNSADLDDDNDGCLDTQEIAADPALGGARSPHHFWDFFDTPGPGNTRDKVISTGDIQRVVLHFGTNGDPGIDPLSAPPLSGYHTAFDRSPPPAGADPWDAQAADGSVAANDILFVVRQFGHSCA
jgi:hypothetical protein